MNIQAGLYEVFQVDVEVFIQGWVILTENKWPQCNGNFDGNGNFDTVILISIMCNIKLIIKLLQKNAKNVETVTGALC